MEDYDTSQESSWHGLYIIILTSGNIYLEADKKKMRLDSIIDLLEKARPPDIKLKNYSTHQQHLEQCLKHALASS
jgi:hypothetical protein